MTDVLWPTDSDTVSRDLYLKRRSKEVGASAFFAPDPGTITDEPPPQAAKRPPLTPASATRPDVRRNAWRLWSRFSEFVRKRSGNTTPNCLLLMITADTPERPSRCAVQAFLGLSRDRRTFSVRMRIPTSFHARNVRCV